MAQSSELKNALSSCRYGFLMAGLFSVFLNLLTLVSPLYMMQIYNKVLPARSEPTLIVLTALACGLLTAGTALEIVRSRILVRISNRLDLKITRRLISAIYLAGISTPREGSAQGLRDFDTLRQFLTGSPVMAFFDLPWSPLLIGVIFMLHPILGLIAVCGALLLIGIAILNEIATKRPMEEANRHSMMAISIVGSSLRNVEALHAMGMMGSLRDRMLGKRGEMLRLQMIGSDRASTILAISKLARTLLQIALLSGGAYLAIHDSLSAGSIIAASIVMGRALAPFESAIGTWKQFVSARESYGRLLSLLADNPPPPVRTQLPSPTGMLRIENLAVVPPGSSVPTLANVNFAVSPGQVLGITGPSGSGKSSLARVIAGSWRPTAGKVRLDGADIHQWDREDLGPFVGYVPQDVELLDGTIAENIARFGEADPVKIVAAAKLARVHELILRQPEGYETYIGQNGRNLSAGQRQRVALARALYGEPVLVILDEPNSNLDIEGDAALIDALFAMKQSGKAVLLISHRPSVLRATDLLLVLNNGTVRMFGERDEVLARIAQTGQTQPPQPASGQQPASAQPLSPAASPATASATAAPPRQVR